CPTAAGRDRSDVESAGQNHRRLAESSAGSLNSLPEIRPTMPRSDRVPLAYLNGRFLPMSEAGIPLQDAGFVWGATVTDRIRTYGHKLYLLTEHLERFRSSCELCSIPQRMPDEELAGIAERLVAINSATISRKAELVLIVFATPGACRPGKPATTPTLGMHAVPLESAP